MTEAILLDLIHGCCPACSPALLHDSGSQECRSDRHVFLLCGSGFRDKNGLNEDQLGACGSVHVLDCGSLVESLFRFKQALDDLELSSVRVWTSLQGRQVLIRYQKLLFTPFYTFTYTHTCQTCTGPAHTLSADPGEGDDEEEEEEEEASPDDHHDDEDEDEEQQVSRFLQQLPALRGNISVLKSTIIAGCFGHGFSTRGGGISSVPTLSSLNLFSSQRRRDPVAVVTENRRRLALHAGFDPQELRLVKVNHASDVWVLGKDEPESYDAMVTNQTGVVLGAPGADCMPILFTDPVSKVIGAAHAGWRGTLMGVAMATVEAMVTEFGCSVSNILVAVGPSIGACCFTLDRDQALDFSRIRPDCVPDPESARPHVNIRLANRVLLQRGGVLPENIHDDATAGRPCVTPCTSCHPELFFSHRRDGLNFGTQVGFLWIKDTEAQAPPPTGMTT